MLDYIKLSNQGVNLGAIKNTKNLDYLRAFNEATGELQNYSYALHKGMKVQLFHGTSDENIGYLTVSGSLHKYWNNGWHNMNDFFLDNVKESVNSLSEFLEIDIGSMRMRQLEIGVNIKLDLDPRDIIQGCMFSGTKPFLWQSTRDEGRYKVAQLSQKLIKVYDKTQQSENKGLKPDKNLIRFEIKFNKMQAINRLGISTLMELLAEDFQNFAKSLIMREWKKVLFVDINKDPTEIPIDYTSSFFWTELLSNRKRQFRYHRDRVNKVNLEKGSLSQLFADSLYSKMTDLLS